MPKNEKPVDSTTKKSSEKDEKEFDITKLFSGKKLKKKLEGIGSKEHVAQFEEKLKNIPTKK